MRGVWLDLAPFEAPAIPEAEAPPGRMPRVRLNGAVPYAQYVWQLRIVDGVTAKPVGNRQLEIDTRSGTRAALALPEEGKLRLVVGLGLTRVLIRVEGYELFEMRLEPREPGYAEAVISLQPHEDR